MKGLVSALILLTAPLGAGAVSIIIPPSGQPFAYLQVGTYGSTVDQVTMTVPQGQVGSGNQVAGTPSIFVAAAARNFPANRREARLTADASTPLTSASNTIPMTTIGWTVQGGSEIAPGTFDGSNSQLVATFISPGGFYVQKTFYYTNQQPVAAGTYSSRVTYTLTIP